MSALAFTRRGTGPTLLLVHGLGSSRGAWEPVIPPLAEHFDVLAVDLPGFGDSPPLPDGVESLPATLAASVADLLHELDIGEVHVAGHSLGCWVALEFAQLRSAASLTLISPAGFWKGRTPRYNLVSLRGSRWLTKHAGGLLSRLVGTRAGRILVLGQTHGRPAHVSPELARATLQALGTCTGFERTLKATVNRHYEAGKPFDAPVTVAFGTRELLLLPRQSRDLHQLPADTRVVKLPQCGHVAMSDDPRAVAELIAAAALSVR
jgi:pimeloyl-ACP methyl ester carboxylesterase